MIILSRGNCDRIYDILDSFYCSFVYRYLAPAPEAETSTKLGKLARSRLSCHSAPTARRLLIKRDACGTRCLISRSDFAAFHLVFYSPLFTASPPPPPPPHSLTNGKRRMQIGRIYTKETTDCALSRYSRNTLVSDIFQFLYSTRSKYSNKVDRSH